MSFFVKFKTGTAVAAQTMTPAPAKKDPNAPQLTPLDKHLKDVSGPVRSDGSDKFFGFENYGSTCYCNSIIQCLYYSAPFRSHVLSFPGRHYLDALAYSDGNGVALPPRSTSQIPYPNVTSPARKEFGAPTSPGGQAPKPEESKDSPEYRKKMALKGGPVLDMIHDNSNRYGMEESLFTALKDIFDAVISNQSRVGVVSPHKFLEILRRENEMFRSAMHQDAHEFLNLLLNQVVDNVESFSKQHPSLNGAQQANGGMQEELQSSALSSLAAGTKSSTANGIDTHWVHDLFEGLLTSETRCLTCENTSHRDEPFLDLSVDLSAHTSVTSCLRKFSEEEMLCERNKFHCDNCGGLQEAEKRMKIKRLPRVLALHLKRFKYTEDLQRLQKLFHRVVYPFHLRLFNTTDDAENPDRLYELYAVVVHIGGGPYHGHYVSIIKTEDRGWLLFDDELVEPVSKAYVLSFFGGEPVPGLQDARQLACAYVLFYQETTLEAVLKEQQMEGQQTSPAAGRVSDAETAKDPSSPLATTATQNGLHSVATITTPILAEEATAMPDHHMESLSHAATAPTFAASSPILPNTGAAVIPLERTKTKKELKAEEKERKAAAKAEAKAEDEKRRQASLRRVEAWKKNHEEYQAVLEASKTTATEEAHKRGEAAPHLIKDKDAVGLARFRHGSMSLRGSKPRWMGGSGTTKGSEKLTDEAVPDSSEEKTPVAIPDVPVSLPSTSTPLPAASPLPPPVPPPLPTSTTANPAPDDGKTARKSHRFSLGRKKSQALS